MKRGILLSLTWAFFGLAIFGISSAAKAACVTPRVLGCCIWLDDDDEGNPVLGIDCDFAF
jgi:hypothetical protein